MAPTEYQNLSYDVRDGKAYVTLNRPEKLNALSQALQEEISQAMWEADNDTRVHCVILGGAGRAFCAGYDLTPAPADRTETYEEVYRKNVTFDDDTWRMEKAQRLRMAIWDMHKPVIGRIHGYCLAGGTDLVLLTDMIVAADDTVIGFPPTRAMGSPPAHMWLYHVGPQWAKRLLLTGDSITGTEAAEIGLVLLSVPYEDLDAAVEEIADKLAMIDPELLAAQKRIVNLGMEIMGARTLQRLASENDARAHLAPSVREFGKLSREKGLKAALEWRDTKFGDGRGTSQYQARKEEQAARAKAKT